MNVLIRPFRVDGRGNVNIIAFQRYIVGELGLPQDEADKSMAPLYDNRDIHGGGRPSSSSSSSASASPITIQYAQFISWFDGLPVDGVISVMLRNEASQRNTHKRNRLRLTQLRDILSNLNRECFLAEKLYDPEAPEYLAVERVVVKLLHSFHATRQYSDAFDSMRRLMSLLGLDLVAFDDNMETLARYCPNVESSNGHTEFAALWQWWQEEGRFAPLNVNHSRYCGVRGFMYLYYHFAYATTTKPGDDACVGDNEHGLVRSQTQRTAFPPYCTSEARMHQDLVYEWIRSNLSEFKVSSYHLHRWWCKVLPATTSKAVVKPPPVDGGDEGAAAGTSSLYITFAAIVNAFLSEHPAFSAMLARETSKAFGRPVQKKRKERPPGTYIPWDGMGDEDGESRIDKLHGDLAAMRDKHDANEAEREAASLKRIAEWEQRKADMDAEREQERALLEELRRKRAAEALVQPEEPMQEPEPLQNLPHVVEEKEKVVEPEPVPEPEPAPPTPKPVVVTKDVPPQESEEDRLKALERAKPRYYPRYVVRRRNLGDYLRSYGQAIFFLSSMQSLWLFLLSLSGSLILQFGTTRRCDANHLVACCNDRLLEFCIGAIMIGYAFMAIFNMMLFDVPSMFGAGSDWQRRSQLVWSWIWIVLNAIMAMWIVFGIVVTAPSKCYESNKTPAMYLLAACTILSSMIFGFIVLGLWIYDMCAKSTKKNLDALEREVELHPFWNQLPDGEDSETLASQSLLPVAEKAVSVSNNDAAPSHLPPYHHDEITQPEYYQGLASHVEEEAAPPVAAVPAASHHTVVPASHFSLIEHDPEYLEHKHEEAEEIRLQQKREAEKEAKKRAKFEAAQKERMESADDDDFEI